MGQAMHASDQMTHKVVYVTERTLDRSRH